MGCRDSAAFVRRVRWRANTGRLGPAGWGLLDGRGAAPRKLVESIPPKALLLVVGGLPCQQFTSIGAGNGRLGLTGKETYRFHIFPAV
eukprot:4294206-Alexandrium_andersonii.AAC.1